MTPINYILIMGTDVLVVDYDGQGSFFAMAGDDERAMEIAKMLTEKYSRPAYTLNLKTQAFERVSFE